MAREQPFELDRLWQGPSDQPPWVRDRRQTERALNVRHSINQAGAVKRAATELKADLSTLDPEKDYLFIAIRDAIVAIGEDEVLAWDDDGVALTVIDETDATGDMFGSYLTRSPDFDPHRDIDYAVALDTIIVCNRFKTVGIERAFTAQEAINFIINGDPDDNTGAPAAASIAAVTAFSDLPGGASNGQYAYVRTSENFDPYGFYIFWDGSTFSQTIFPEHDNWFRIPRSGQVQARYTPSTMPHRIVYNQDAGTVTFGRIEWAQRLTGNQGSNPVLPFVHSTIKAVEFHAGRLWLLGRDSINMSRTSDYFNLFANVAGEAADDDRISYNHDERNAGEILRAAVAGDNVFVMCENAQFQVGSGDNPLTAANTRTRRVRSLKALDVQPGVSDTLIVMLDRSKNLHHFRWFGVELGGLGYVGWMNSHHETVLRGRTPFRIDSIPNASFVCSADANLLVHDHLEGPESIVQSAFSDYAMQGTVWHVSEWSAHLRFVTRDDDGYTLVHHQHRRPDNSESLQYQVRLDRLELKAGTYDADLNETIFEHSGREGDMGASRLVLKTDQGAVGPAHLFLVPSEVETNGRVHFKGQITGQHYLGFKFTAEIELSNVFGNLRQMMSKVREVVVYHYESVGYEARLPDRNGATRTSQANVLSGSEVVNTGLSKHLAQFDARERRVTLRSDSPGPVTWVSINYEIAKEGTP